MNNKIIIFITSSLLILTACVSNTAPIPIKAPLLAISTSSQFNSVWAQIMSDPVKTLPQVKVSYKKLTVGGNNKILSDATRTLSSRLDILPYFDKLAHPNGICFKGVWKINAENKYSGYFKNGSKGLIIIRASSAMSNTQSGQLRSFGFAGKIFPTMNPAQKNLENTANFFLIDDLGGTRARHYTDVTMTNSPPASMTSEVFKNLLYATKLARTFSQADKNAKIRQVYEISQLGEKNKASVITPKWMKVKAAPDQTIDEADFRDELRIHGNKLIFIVSVASKIVDGKKDWSDIGLITLDKSIVSNSCDHRLHFHHPKWKSDLIH